MCACGCPQRPEESNPGAGVTGSCKPPDQCAGNQTGLLWKSGMYFTAHPSFQDKNVIFKLDLKIWREGPGAKSTYCFCRGTRFSFQQYGGSQLSSPRDPTPSSDLRGLLHVTSHPKSKILCLDLGRGSGGICMLSKSRVVVGSLD